MFKKAMKQATFGVKINADNVIVVMEFKMSCANLIEYVNNYYENVHNSYLHIAANHIIPSLKSTNTDNGLGIFSEQAGESIHHVFKKTWIRYETTKPLRIC